ncbi:antibiotic resistance protein [Halalkalibacter wakoensis JCM 9140]|uniref:Antibiotic resistance protein n=1 Tax=Halalkalibacter wakoensis JCM 9140 TaxID=1236970 RepID=W4Q1L9_9BACI|nr:MFS transporter [Halalkalibacter wakoensis]GAE25946.1 antibiotic resistance protein [Halalkalibacter wakoensis JCM 9140]
MKASKQPIWTKDFLCVAFVNLIIFIAFYALLTTLPIYVVYQLGGTEAQAGLVVTVMLVAAILIRPFSGNLLQRFGKRNVLIVSTIFFTVTSFLYTWVDQFLPLLILRFLHGFSFAILTTATSTLATDIVPSERRGEGLGYFTMFLNVAIVVGPFAGLMLIQHISFQQFFLFLSCFVIMSIICSMLLSTKGIPKPIKNTVKRRLSIHQLFETKALPFAFIISLVSFAYAAILSFISVYAIEIHLEQLSGYFFIVLAITMLVSRPYLSRLFDQRGPKIVILPSLLVFASGFTLLAVSQSAWLFLLAAGVIGVGYGSLMPLLLSLATERVDSSRTGHATATFFTLYDIGVAVGAFWLGLLVPMIGFSNMFHALAIFVLLIFAIFYYLHQRMHVSIKKKTTYKMNDL